ncbi:MAG: protein-S-isoprenylcysteine O-methyltransferase Ste14 [Saprospiraceae bacterium]|jgi:protein-S-isoprenylcysteine O-methyltransferase Ste14
MEFTNLILFAISLSIYFAVHSILANLKVKSFLMELLIPKKIYRLVYNFLSLVFLLPLAWFYLKINSVMLFEVQWLSYFGLVITIVGAVLLFIALRQYDLSEFSGTQQLNLNQTNTSNYLRTTGFNSIVRHPLYFSGLLLIWGWWLFQATDLFLVAAVVTTAYIYVGTKLEEQKLVLAFGEVYLEYQKKVGMLVPIWKSKYLKL